MSSELKSMYAFFAPDDISEAALQHYLTFQYVPEPDCLTKSVKKAEAGAYDKKK